MINKAIEKIKTQQGAENTIIFMIGEQLKDICREGENIARLVYEDLDNITLESIEKVFSSYASKNKVGNQSCITPIVADRLIRETLCLPPKASNDAINIKPKVINIMDLFE